MAEQGDYTGGSRAPSTMTGGAGPPLASVTRSGNGGGPSGPGGSPAASLREQVASLKDEARRETVRIAEDAREQAGALVRRRQQLVAERLGVIASALREAGLRLEREAGLAGVGPGAMRSRAAATGGGVAWPAAPTADAAPATFEAPRSRPSPLPAAAGLDAATRGLWELMDQAAERVDRAAGYLRTREPGELLHDLEGFARRRPAAFVGGGLVAGFLLARFFKSSGERAARPEPATSEPLAATPLASGGPAAAGGLSADELAGRR